MAESIILLIWILHYRLNVSQTAFGSQTCEVSTEYTSDIQERKENILQQKNPG